MQKHNQSIRGLILTIFLISCLDVAQSFAFISSSNGASAFKVSGSIAMRASDSESASTSSPTTNEPSAVKKSLEEKMKDWESTDEEIKEKSLGGLYVGRKTDGFENGLVLAFSVIAGSGVLFAVFSNIVGQN